MKFGYSYKTSDGSRHEDVFEARTKEDTFAALRAKGIKPIKVWEIRPWYCISKRTQLTIVLGLALLVALGYIFAPRFATPPRESEALVSLRAKAAALAERHKADIALADGDHEKIAMAVERTHSDARKIFKDILSQIPSPSEQLEAKRLYGELMLMTDTSEGG